MTKGVFKHMQTFQLQTTNISDQSNEMLKLLFPLCPVKCIIIRLQSNYLCAMTYANKKTHNNSLQSLSSICCQSNAFCSVLFIQTVNLLTGL